MKNNNFIYHGHGISEPIGLEYIVSSISEYCNSIKFISHVEVEIVLISNHRISLFSATTAEWNRVLSLNRESKERGNITIVGGYHISGNYKNEKELPFDYVVVGEGEYIIQDIVKEIINNYTSKDNKEKTQFRIAKPLKDIDKLKFPLRDRSFLSNYMIYDLMYPAPSNQVNTSIILGSRGCKYNCSFCASSSVWGIGLRTRKIDNILSEIIELQDIYNTNTIVFIDQSLGQEKKWTIDLCQAIIKNKIKINWYHQSNINIDKSLIPLMAEAGCTKIGFGVEGISPSAISNIKPINTLQFNEINELFDLCNDNGIFIKAYLMIGFPWETMEIIEEYFEYLPLLRSNMVKIAFFTPFPGTKDWDKYSQNLNSNDWSEFDTVAKPVVKNPVISSDEYLKIRQRLFRTFYQSATFKRTTLKMLDKFPHYEKSYNDFFDYLRAFKMVPNEIGNDELLNQNNKLVFEKTCS